MIKGDTQNPFEVETFRSALFVKQKNGRELLFGSKVFLKGSSYS